MRNTVFILTFLTLFACVAAQPTTGKCGKNVTWTFQSNGTLVLEGSGDTYDYGKKPQKSPFMNNGISEKIKVVDLTRYNADGRLGNNLFYGCTNLEKIKLHQSQNKMIHPKAFTNCLMLTTIEYSNNYVKTLSPQDNYYKIVLNAINIGIPSVKQCIVPTTSEKAEDMFTPLEPFPPIESYNNLRRENWRGGGGYHYGQWENGDWNGVVKTSWDNGDYRITYFEKGRWINSKETKCKEEYHRSYGTWWIENRLANQDYQEDKYKSDTSSLPYLQRVGHSDTQFVKRVFTNNDCFLGVFVKDVMNNKWMADQGTFQWANGNLYQGHFKDLSYNFTDLVLLYPNNPDMSNGAYISDCSTCLVERFIGKGIYYNARTGKIQCGLWENGKYKGSPEVINLQDFLDFPKILPFNSIAKIYMENEINEWQEKQEFETTAEWQTRVTETTRQQKANELYVQLQNDYLENYAKKINLDLKLGRYDADNRTYLVTDSVYGPMIVSLENIAPQAFKTSWDKIIPVPTYFINGNGIDILEMDFILDNRKVAHYQKTAELTYVNVNVDYDFNPIALPQMGTIKGGGEIVTGNTTDNNHVKNPPASPLSDVDLNIPVVDRTNYNTHVFIIANENYTKASKVPYALKDGRVFKEYCEKTLGVLPNHIKKYENATLGDLNECVAKMQQVGKVYGKKANIIFYYAGHAYTDPSGVYFLPADGNTQISITSYSERKLFDELGELPVNSVTCFIDACYSGKSGRGIIVQPKEGALKGNLVVISASSEDETADQYSGKGHGLFTYCLLKKLRDTKGDVTLGELSDYIIEQVQRISLEVNDKLQTPTSSVSPFMELDWRQLKLNE